MIVLTIKTNEPEAELCVFNDSDQLDKLAWEAHLKLAETINDKINKILNKSSISMGDIKGIIIFSGPGSFTGLRIGFSVANSLAYSLEIPIVGAGGKNWIKAGMKDLGSGKNHRIALPEYGQAPNTSTPRK